MGQYSSYFITVAILTCLQTANCIHREHKVHNIVLYPDKHSWCQTQQIKQVVSYPGCKSEEIDNNVCVGACFSYSIPHTEPSDPGEVIVPYCDSCQPSNISWNHITLQCEQDHETAPQLVKRVQIINNCSCSSCEGSHNRYKNSNDDISDVDDSNDFLMMQQNEIPDLLRTLNNRNESLGTISENTATHSESVKSIMNHKIITLLKDIQEKNSRYDKEQLMDLLRAIQGSDHNKISDEKIIDFVESLNSENVELDLTRLREVLKKFEHSKYYEKQRKHMFAAPVANDMIDNGETDDRLDNLNSDSNVEVAAHHSHQHHHLLNRNHKSYHHHLNSDISLNDSVRQQQTHQQHHHYHHHHHHQQQQHHEIEATDASFIEESNSRINENTPESKMESVGNEKHHSPKHHYQNLDDVVIDSIINHYSVLSTNISGTTMKDDAQDGKHHHHHMQQHPDATTAHHHHHQVGEEIVGHGHLVKGPNGALVIEPDRSNDDGSTVQEKFDVNPHELKPNHAGTLLSYSGQQSVIVNSARNSPDDIKLPKIKSDLIMKTSDLDIETDRAADD